jgi:hypothetical protein
MIGSSKLCRFGAMVLVLFLAAASQAGQKHLGYLRTMDDLRLARALLQRANEAQALNDSQDEVSLTITNIDTVIAELDGVARADGKKVRALPRIDSRMPWAERLNEGLRLLERAKEDCRSEKNDAADGGLRARILNQLDQAQTRITVAIETFNFDYSARSLPTRND